MSEDGTWPVRYCAACGEDTPQDGLGCRRCRHRAAERSDAISRRNRRNLLIGVGVGISALVAWRFAVSVGGSSSAATQAPPEPKPAPATPRPNTYSADDSVAEQAARIVASWCRLTTESTVKADTWRDPNLGTIANVSVDHDRKAERFDGNVLWYQVQLGDDGTPLAIQATKRVAGVACRDIGVEQWHQIR